MCVCVGGGGGGGGAPPVTFEEVGQILKKLMIRASANVRMLQSLNF